MYKLINNIIPRKVFNKLVHNYSFLNDKILVEVNERLFDRIGNLTANW